MLSELLLLGVLLAGAEQAVLEEVNAHRRELGLRDLAWDERAAAEARRHCSDVLRGAAREPHAGFELRAARLRRATGAARAAENIFLLEGRDFSARRALAEWLGSPGHRRAIEGPYERSGVGVVERGGAVCAVQIFLGR